MTTGIEVSDVSKRFKIFHERNTSIKSIVLHRGRRTRFEEFWALRDVSLSVQQGESFALVGHNGSGKSTLLKCIAGIMDPDRGSLKVIGKVSALLELGAGFHPDLSGRENVFLNGAILGLSQRELKRRFDDIVGFAGLEQFIDHPVKNYSSGMYARLGFSVMINVDPDVLLIDEVLAVGDEQFQRRCMEKIYEFRTSGKTVVIVSHALGTLRNLCDRAAWIHHGEVAKLGLVNDVVDAYLESTGQGVGSGLVTPDAPGRLGSGEIRVERVEILDSTGKSVDRVKTGDDVIFRVWWFCDAPVEQPVIAISVSRTDGVVVAGSSSKVGQLDLGYVSTAGRLDFSVDRLPLLPATFVVRVDVTDKTNAHIYDQHLQAVRFDVSPGLDRGADGVVTLGGRWSRTE